MLFLALCLRAITSTLFATLRIELHGKKELLEAAKGPLIIALWHDGLILAPLIRKILTDKRLAIVVSNSKDGKILAAYAETFKNVESIFAVHNRRYAALLQTVDAIKNDKAILITPDGPRGPRHVLKPGVFFAEKKANASIIAMTWTAKHYWQLHTWDKMRIPKPFAKIRLTFSLACKDDLAEKL